MLTQEGRLRLGGTLAASCPRLGTAGMWMELRGVSLERAVIEVAQALRSSDDWTARWLLREVGEETPLPIIPDRPAWHPESGELRWGGQVIRRVRVAASFTSLKAATFTAFPSC